MKLLTIDIGNSNAKFGLFHGERLEFRSSLPTRDLASGRVPKDITERLSRRDELVIASVVPEAVETVSDAIEDLTGRLPMIVDHSMDFGMSIDYEPKEDCGIDRLLAAAAVPDSFGIPAIVCDFGTATTIDVIDRERVYRGGIIAPGVRTFSESLFRNTSKLPFIEPEETSELIGNSTRAAIRSGTYFGYKGLVEGIVEGMKREIGEEAKVIATGGFAEFLSHSTVVIDAVEPHLVLTGLRMVHTLNRAPNT